MLNRILYIFITIITFQLTCTMWANAQDLQLHKPSSSTESNYSGDNQQENAGATIKNPIRVLVTNMQGISVTVNLNFLIRAGRNWRNTIYRF